MMAKSARNAPCPCGSGHKYKHCCQVEEERWERQARDEDRVGRSISDWSGYLDLHNFRNRNWKPAQAAVGIEPFRRIYDLRHTFATFALRAGISTFEFSRYMGASLTMIDRHYGHLARDGREHAIRLLDDLNASAVDARGRPVDSESTGFGEADNRNRR